MKRNSFVAKLSGAALVPVLAFALGSTVCAQEHHDDNRDAQNTYNRGNDRDAHNSADRGNGRDAHANFQFGDQHRSQFAQHYSRDADQWRNRQNRAHFTRGERIPAGYRIQPVPASYYRGVPPPAGYRYGYYQGYVVAYDPTTRVIGDVLDLVNAAAH